MSEVIDLKHTIGIVANLCNLPLFANIFVRTVLTDLQIFPILMKIDIHIRYTIMHV